MHLQCSHCERAFTKTEHLRRHERAHTKERPFECNVCRKAYARSDVLARHMRMHMRKEEVGSEQSSPQMRNGHHTPRAAPYTVKAEIKTRENGHDKHASQDYSSLNTLQRYNMSALDDSTTAAYQSPRQYYAAPFSTQPPGYTQPPTPTEFMPANGSNLNGSVSNYGGMHGYANGSAYPSAIPLPTIPYSQDRYATPLSDADFRTSPIQYANFPPSSGPDQEIDIAPSVFPHPHAPTVWHNPVKDAMESNVRASGIQGYANVQAQQEYVANGYLPKPSGAAGTQLPLAANDLHRWLEINSHHNPVNNILMLGNDRSSIDMTYPIANTMTPSLKVPHMTPLQQDGQIRFPRVEQSWYQLQAVKARLIGAEKHWYDILKGMDGDLFNSQPPTCSIPSDGSRVTVSEECRLRMIKAVYPPADKSIYDPASLVYTTNQYNLETIYNRFPSCEAFSEALERYFDSFLREAPFIHMPAFSISTCHPLLLFVMSCIGFGLAKKEEDCRFVTGNFLSLRDRILQKLEEHLTSTVKDAMSIFATAFIFLKLAALITAHDHLSPCQLMYVSLVNLAQMHGMFSDYGKRTTPELYDSCSSLDAKWKAWGRVESLKRISVSLLRLDSAYATFLKSAPVLKVNVIEMPLPCDDRLFEAPTAEIWQSLISNEQLPPIMPAMALNNSLDRLVGGTYLNYYSLHAVLNYLQVRTLDAFQKLLEFQLTQQKDAYVVVPYQFYRTDPALENMTVHIIAFIDSYERLLPRYAADWQRTNCLVFWHFLCLSLTVNQDLFEIAVGREGPKLALQSAASIESWSKTRAARRALLHSATIYRLISERQASEMNSLYAAFGVFASALAVTMFVFANSAIQSTRPGTQPYELTSEVHWQNFGLAGLDEATEGVTGSAAETFVLHGGPFTFRGQQVTGFEGAQYILTVFAELLKTCGRYNYRDMARVLKMVQRTITESMDGDSDRAARQL